MMFHLFLDKKLGETCTVQTECSDQAAYCPGKCTCDSTHYDDNGFTLGGNCQPGMHHYNQSLRN